MIPVMAVVAEADEITVIECQLRIFIIVLDVVNGDSFSLPAVSLAALTHISVTSEDSSAFMFPA